MKTLLHELKEQYGFLENDFLSIDGLRLVQIDNEGNFISARTGSNTKAVEILEIMPKGCQISLARKLAHIKPIEVGWNKPISKLFVGIVAKLTEDEAHLEMQRFFYKKSGNELRQSNKYDVLNFDFDQHYTVVDYVFDSFGLLLKGEDKNNFYFRLTLFNFCDYIYISS